jgi:essential nuclear protein 1
MVEYDGEYVDGNDLTEAEEALVHRFLDADRHESRNLADIILDKIKEKDLDTQSQVEEERTQAPIPPKVVEVYTMVGKMLKIYKSGKLPKALKMLPHLKNWEVCVKRCHAVSSLISYH